MGLTVLLADGSIASQNSAKKILTDAGYEVVAVSNGLAADHKISELHPEIALLDVYMPGYSGLEVCERAKAAPQTAQMPVLLTVGRMEAFRAEDGIKVRADGVITKPFEAKDLLATIGRLVQSQDQPGPAILVGQEPVSGESAGNGQSRPQDAPKRATMAESPRPIREATQPVRHEPAAQPDMRASAGSSQGGQVCDVCGAVNAEHALVCHQCDVPLPSSLPSRLIASRNQ